MMTLKEKIVHYNLNPVLCEICSTPVLYGRARQGARTCSMSCGQANIKKKKEIKNKETKISITNNSNIESCIEIKYGKTNNGFKFCAIDNDGILSIVNPPDYSEHPLWIENLKKFNQKEISGPIKLVNDQANQS